MHSCDAGICFPNKFVYLKSDNNTGSALLKHQNSNKMVIDKPLRVKTISAYCVNCLSYFLPMPVKRVDYNSLQRKLV